MADTGTFLIDDREYAMPTSFRLIDPVLIREITGLEWPQFTERLDGIDADDPAADEADMDPVVLLGLVAVAVWQQHPRWTREKVKRYVGELDIAALTFRGDEGGGDPPSVPGHDPASTSLTSPELANAPAAESVSAPIPLSSGTPESGTGSPDFTPA